MDRSLVRKQSQINAIDCKILRTSSIDVEIELDRRVDDEMFSTMNLADWQLLFDPSLSNLAIGDGPDSHTSYSLGAGNEIRFRRREGLHDSSRIDEAPAWIFQPLSYART